MQPSPPPMSSAPSPSERAAQLADELTVLRDALVTLSLSLKDWQFELDSQGPQASHTLAAQVLDAARQRPLGTGLANTPAPSTEGK